MRTLTPADLRWRYPASTFAFATTASVRPLRGILGQELAFEALKTGIEMRQPGCNIYVAGPNASSRRPMIRECLRRFMPALPPPDDRVYVNNFAAPYRPRLLEFPAGRGGDFCQALDDLTATVKKEVAALAQAAGPRSRIATLRARFEKRRNHLRGVFERDLKGRGFVLGQIRTADGVRPDIFFLHEQKPTSIGELEELTHTGKFSAARFARIGRAYESKMKEFGAAMAKITQLDQEYAQELLRLERDRIGRTLRGVIQDLTREFPHPKVAAHLRQLRDGIIDKINLFRPRPHQDNPDAEERDRFREFRGNLVTSGAGLKGPPVVFENTPTFSNLFGFIERPGVDDGGLSDFLDIRPGSLLEADRGFLVLSISDILQSAPLWNAFKTVLRTGHLAVQEPEGPPNPGPMLKPEPIPVDVKVILVGEQCVFDMLYDMDPEFRHNFKIRVELEPDFPLTPALLRKGLPAYVARTCRQDGLLPLDRGAMAAVAEHGVRMSGRRDKFTASVGKIADLLREANYLARARRSRCIRDRHIKAADARAIQRVNSCERRMTEAIADGTIMIATRGEVIGQINGLAVYDVGDYTFGRPSKITAQVAAGRAGIINIERESGMSRATHDKGVHILSGYLRGIFAQKRPLSLTASICFEQSYSGVEGDSASASEVFAILSSLAEAPIRQDIAVTGSINQKGEIQAIGNVNEKIEGFYDVVRAARPTGAEGVVIPESNAIDLMLREDVLAAVKARRFRIWTIKTIEEGLPILMGLKAGARRGDGTWTPGSVFDRADRHLERLARVLSEYDRWRTR